jgi:hypothetical protein
MFSSIRAEKEAVVGCAAGGENTRFSERGE